MRLFTGIQLSEEVAANLTRLLDLLRPTGHLKWTPAYNLHLTTKFIGERPESQVPEIIERLKPLAKRAALPIAVEGIGWFPNPHNPRVLWAGVKAGDSLGQLAADTDEALAGIGVERETKKYSPHLTLARIKDAVPLAPVRQTIAQLPSVDFGSFRADRFFLYQSAPGPSGSIYTHLAEFPLIPE